MTESGFGKSTDRVDVVRTQAAVLRQRAAALRAIAVKIVHDARNNRLQAQLLRRMRQA